MTLPTPRVVHGQIQEFKDALDRFEQEFRWFHSTAWTPTVTSEPKVKTSRGMSPTESLGSRHRAIERRKNGERAVQKIYKAMAMVLEAKAIVTANLPNPRPAATAPEKDSAVGPRVLKERRENQRKHLAMGEGWGES